MALAIAARQGETSLVSLPAVPETDGVGVPMEIVFPAGIAPGGGRVPVR